VTKYSALLFCEELVLFVVCEKVFCIGVFFLGGGELVLFVVYNKLFCIAVLWGGGTVCGR